MSNTDAVTKITNQKDCRPGHLYCAVVNRQTDHGDLDCFEGLYWFCNDGELYASGGFFSDDDIQTAHPEYDYLVEQVGSFDASYAS